jgi:hypothetical protein
MEGIIIGLKPKHLNWNKKMVKLFENLSKM